MIHSPTPLPDRAIFGAGCFWCTEAVFQKLRGVLSVTPGYTGGNTQNPTYEDVSSGNTGHIEVATIMYDPGVISYKTLLMVFFSSHDPTSIDQQGADSGPQYRSIICTTTDAQTATAYEVKKYLETNHTFPAAIVTDIVPASIVYPAEEYHQRYYSRHENEPYCQFVISPKLQHIREQFSTLF